MDAVARGATVYLLLLVIFRLAGRRTMAQMTSFDFVLLLIISEATQNAMIGEDYSITNGALVVLTLVGLDVLLSHVVPRRGIVAGRVTNDHRRTGATEDRYHESSACG